MKTEKEIKEMLANYREKLESEDWNVYGNNWIEYYSKIEILKEILEE